MPVPGAARWWQPFRTVDPASVVYVDLTPDAVNEAAALVVLDAEEQARCGDFEYAAPRRRFVLCRAALRAVLCGELGCENEQLTFETARRGKPSAMVDGRPAPISFNVSHSGRHGLIAFAPRGRLGVDIEERTTPRRLDLLAEAALSEEERAAFASKRGAEQICLFFRLWTMKEALLKAHGEGFLLDATAFEIPRSIRQGEPSGALQLPQLAGVTWQVQDVGDERFAAALAQEVAGDDAC